MLSENAYSRPVTLKNVLRFAVPTIVMTVFMSFYTMVDGLFVSNLIGTDALSAVNLTAPIISLVTAISTMLAVSYTHLDVYKRQSWARMASRSWRPVWTARSSRAWSSGGRERPASRARLAASSTRSMALSGRKSWGR